ncbi:MAG TPA: alpha/beta hydrolase [Methanoregula sp.]|nr:alpha/beta hydrolase [Methanoregula sp.]
MIRESPEDLLTTLKSHVPDPTQPLATVRKDLSVFYAGLQEEIVMGSDHRLEGMSIRNGLRGIWVSLPDSLAERVVLFFHGGTFTTGSTDSHLGLCIRLARASRARVFSVDYRLAPEHVFPAAVEDAVAAYRFLIAKGYTPHHIVPVGISAGGTLVLSLLISARDQGLPLPLAAVCMSPVTDMEFSGESILKNRERDWITPESLHAMRTVYLAGRDPKDPLASPVHARLAGLPRLYVQAGTHELLISDIGAFVDKARWAGVPVQAEIWEGMFHCWQLCAGQIPEGQEAIDQAGLFIGDMLAR